MCAEAFFGRDKAAKPRWRRGLESLQSFQFLRSIGGKMETQSPLTGPQRRKMAGKALFLIDFGWVETESPQDGDSVSILRCPSDYLRDLQALFLFISMPRRLI